MSCQFSSFIAQSITHHHPNLKAFSFISLCRFNVRRHAEEEEVQGSKTHTYSGGCAAYVGFQTPCHLGVVQLASTGGGSREMLDALILDASCQSRTPGILPLRGSETHYLKSIYSTALKVRRERSCGNTPMISPCHKYVQQSTSGDRSLSDNTYRIMDFTYDTATEEQRIIVGLSLSNTVISSLSQDENGGLFSYLLYPVYTADPASPGGEAHDYLFDFRYLLAS